MKLIFTCIYATNTLTFFTKNDTEENRIFFFIFNDVKIRKKI